VVGTQAASPLGDQPGAAPRLHRPLANVVDSRHPATRHYGR